MGTANPIPRPLNPQDDIYDPFSEAENIDLKNHVERKMQKLERKTQRAMIEPSGRGGTPDARESERRTD